MKDLKDLIISCQKKDMIGQRELYERFSPELFGVCLRYCKDRTEAEDNLHEGFIKIYTNINQYRFKGSFQGWMRRIVVNTIIESFRKKNPVYFVDSIEDYNVIEESEVKIPPALTVQELLTHIEMLPPKYKLVFNLYALEGYSHQEISDILKISIGTSKSNLSRARNILKNKITTQLKDITQTA